MGTNYYVQRSCPEACAHCSLEDRHIGKRSAGWQFTFRAHQGITSRSDWESLIREPAVVVDEYGQKITPEEFWTLVDQTRNGRQHQPGDASWVDPDGWDFLDVEFS